MSDPEPLPASIHPESQLLPWYVSGTLPEEERRQVAQHLETCADCRRELDDVSRIKRDLTGFYDAQAAPSPRLAHAVKNRAFSAKDSSAMVRLDRWLGSLFLPRWVPTLAAMLLVAQMGLIAWLTFPESPAEQVQTRSVGVASPILKVGFRDGATEGDIRALLTASGGRIIDGPDAAGLYLIQAAAPETFQMLRQRTDVVRTADPVAP